jgi:hypothetical protein
MQLTILIQVLAEPNRKHSFIGKKAADLSNRTRMGYHHP